MAVAALIPPTALLAAAPAHALDHSWTGGNFMPGTSAPNPLSTGSTLSISGLGQKLLLGMHFSNLGTVNWLPGGCSPGMGIGASFNKPAMWNLQHDGALDHQGGATSTFTTAPSGTLRKTACAGSTRIGNNTPGFAPVKAGTIEPQAGTIELGAPPWHPSLTAA